MIFSLHDCDTIALHFSFNQFLALSRYGVYFQIKSLSVHSQYHKISQLFLVVAQNANVNATNIASPAPLNIGHNVVLKPELDTKND